ncbi:hypothetical protein N9Y42_09335 [Mariniblastus sp.]|nr:hypothetical protein [Mariniblastus sp.]
MTTFFDHELIARFTGLKAKTVEQFVSLDRRFQFRTNEHYGMWALRNADVQVFATLGDSVAPKPTSLCFAVFNSTGDFIRFETHALPDGLDPPVDMQRTLNYYSTIHNLTNSQISVAQFEMEDTEAFITRFPQYMIDYIAFPDPNDPGGIAPMIRAWILDNAFVMNRYNDYFVDGDGVVVSS